MTDQKQADIVVIKKFFDFKPGQDLKGFKEEIDQLSEDEKRWLATEAGKALAEAAAAS